jgi:hypothetical protein
MNLSVAVPARTLTDGPGAAARQQSGSGEGPGQGKARSRRRGGLGDGDQDKRLTERLGIPAGTPVAEHIRTGYTATDKPVRVMVSVVPGDTLILQYIIPT